MKNSSFTNLLFCMVNNSNIKYEIVFIKFIRLVGTMNCSKLNQSDNVLYLSAIPTTIFVEISIILKTFFFFFFFLVFAFKTEILTK
jgi:hypothetical protein